MMTTDRVLTAIEVMMKEVGNTLQALNQAGAKAFQEGDYDRARMLMDRGPRLAEFFEQIKQLAHEWEAISNGIAPTQPAASSPKPQRAVSEAPPAPSLDPAPAQQKPATVQEPVRGGGLLSRDVRVSFEEPAELQSYTPEEEFLIPILQALFKLGGSGLEGEVFDAVEEILGNRLNDEDYLPMSSDNQLLRWHNSAHWARAAMIEEGLLSPDSMMGLWQITNEGRQWLAEKMSKPY